DRLSRTAGIDAAVWEVDLADLRALDVGRWFAPGFEGERIPTLEDVVAALPAGVRLVADFKHGEDRFPGFATRVADIVRPLGHRYATISIQHAFALDLASRLPGALALLTFRRPPATDEEVKQLRELPPGAGLAMAMRALSAAVLGGANGFGFRDAPLLGTMLGALGGATNGAILVAAILGTEIFLPPTRLGHALERVPFLVAFAMKFLVYGSLIVLALAARPGG